MMLDFYFARRFLGSFTSVFGIFIALFLMMDMVEQIRKFDAEVVGFTSIFAMALLNTPTALYQVLPLIMIISTLTLFLALARSSELVVARAAGRSALRSLAAPAWVALCIGYLAIGIGNPIVAATQKEYVIRENAFKNGNQAATNITSVSAEGLWLRQGGPTGQIVIRAAQSNMDATILQEVTFLGFTPDGKADYRIEAERATLEPGQWTLENAKMWRFQGSNNPERDAQKFARHALESDLTRDQIRDSFGAPSTIPIWELPGFIGRLDAAGFSARAHKMWFQMELSLPLMLVAMMLVGAGFSMQHARFGSKGFMILTAILSAFAIFFLRNFVQILGENGQIPILAAAWAPPVIAILATLGLLLHLEDG